MSDSSTWLPLRVRGPIRPYFIRSAEDVENAGLGLADSLTGVFGFRLPSSVLFGHRIVRDFLEVALADEILQRLGRLLFVVSVVVDHHVQREEIILQHRLFRAPDG